MSDLPHKNAGYVQVEETAFRKATDTEVYQKIGSNLNFLKDQVDSANALAISIFTQTSQVVSSSSGFGTDGGGNFQGVISQSPNGKPLLFAAANVQIAGYAIPFPLLCIGNYIEAPLWSSGGQVAPNYQGNFPLLALQFTGPQNNQLYASVFNGLMQGGKFSSNTWGAGTGGVIHFIYVYPS